ncbi:MAG: thymidine phosphorylase [archaeon]|nr:thymidine phosphorylase [archaeon]
MDEGKISSMISSILNGEEQGKESIFEFISHVKNDSISQEYVVEWLKTMHQHGCTNLDVIHLTTAMRESGATLTWQSDKPIVDKHSTGGVGDKMSIMLAPALAACGVRVPMLAGRSLGHTGGTIDKLESIPNFSCIKTPEEMKTIVEEVGCCIVAQNTSIAPADGRLYALRDVTNTIDNVQLITASILSKKSAEGLDALVLDVKYGSAAFMKTLEEARALARSMVDVGNGCGIKTVAQLTRMDEPIGSHIGNALEVLESIHVLNGQGHEDTKQLVVLQGGTLLHLSGKAENEQEGQEMIRHVLKNGQAKNVFKAMCIAQGVPIDTAEQLVSHPEDVLPSSKFETLIRSEITGYVTTFDTMKIAQRLRSMGAGRVQLSDDIDHAVGLIIHRHVGDEVKKGDVVLTIHHSVALSEEEQNFFSTCYSIQNQPLRAKPRLHSTVS